MTLSAVNFPQGSDRQTETYEAAEDLSSWINKIVYLASSASLAVKRMLVASGAYPIAGVLTNKPASGVTAEVVTRGRVWCESDGSVSAGQFVFANTSGQATTVPIKTVKLSSSTSGGAAYALGVALQTDNAAGDLILIRVGPEVVTIQGA